MGSRLKLLKYKWRYKYSGEKEKCFFEREREYLSVDEVNRDIAEAINNRIPFFVGRFGGTEMMVMDAVINHRLFKLVDNRKKCIDLLGELSGFFPCDIEKSEQFTDMMLECCKEVDVQAIWDLYMEEYVLDAYAPVARTTRLKNISPWVKYLYGEINSIPWSAALKDKKVLVIHPFAETIKSQYINNREKIFKKLYKADDILPEFELHVLKAVQTIAGNKDERFNDWFEALDWMVDECKKIDFDVAIIGCGAYGYPLGCEIKKMGKVAIHLGGATQLMFGIMGKRWESMTNFVEQVVNDSWVRPLETEKPKNSENVESSCYW